MSGPTFLGHTPPSAPPIGGRACRAAPLLPLSPAPPAASPPFPRGRSPGPRCCRAPLPAGDTRAPWPSEWPPPPRQVTRAARSGPGRTGAAALGALAGWDPRPASGSAQSGPRTERSHPSLTSPKRRSPGADGTFSGAGAARPFGQRNVFEASRRAARGRFGPQPDPEAEVQSPVACLRSQGSEAVGSSTGQDWRTAVFLAHVLNLSRRPPSQTHGETCRPVRAVSGLTGQHRGPGDTALR